MIAAVVETFENLAFMEPEHVPGGQPAFGDSAICYRLVIESPFPGRMSLAMEPDLAATIAGTIWSGDPAEIGEQLCRDTVAEILNTVAGRFMKAAIPDDQLFALGLPEPCEPESATAEKSTAYPFRLEDSLFRIDLVL
jgi:CheY-specific phosphatase CheX